MYTPPTFAHLPDVKWPTVTTQTPAATGSAPRADINAVASSPSDTQAQIAAEGSVIREVYGRARIGAQIADALVYQGKLVLWAIWCGGPIEAVESYAIGDQDPAPEVTATHYTGAAGQGVDPTLAAAYLAAGITYTDTLPGIAYSVVTIPPTDSAGFPTLTATIKGRKLYDPRTGLTAWSQNPALALADFIASPVYGQGRAVDQSTVGALADACDELVGGAPRRQIGLCLDRRGDTRQWIESLRTYAGAWVAEGPDGLKLVADRPASPVMAITADDTIEGSVKIKKLARRQAPTVVTVRWTDTTATPWADRTAIAYAPGVEAGTTPYRESEITLPGIQSHAQAYREAVERLNHAQLEDIEVAWEHIGLDALEVGDVITLTDPVGLDAKPLRLTRYEQKSPGIWAAGAREYDPAAYSDAVVSEPTWADTGLPDPANPPALASLAATEEVYQLDTGIFASRLRATWAATEFPYLTGYRVEVYRLGVLIDTATARAAEYVTGAVQEGVEYVIKVATISSIGAVGAWAQANITPAGKMLIPGDVPSMSGFEAGGKIYLYWTPAVDLDIWRYELRYGTTGGTWEAATLIDRIDALRYVAQDIPVGTWKIWGKALDSVGQYSTNAASVTITVTSDASAFLVDRYEQTAPTLSNVAEYALNRYDGVRRFVTEDGAMFGTKYSANLATYTNALATYHASVTSTLTGESEDFGQVLGGDWRGETVSSALSGSISQILETSQNGSAWTTHAGLTAKTNARFARVKLTALTTATLYAEIPGQAVRLDAIPRSEVGAGTSSAAGAVTITLANQYTAVKRLTITPEGSTARSYTYDAISLGVPTTFQVHIFDAAGNRIASPFRYDFQGV